jgi:hypothetical protein
LQIFSGRHVERHAEPLEQEASRPDMIGMKVGRDDARQRAVFEHRVEQRFPGGQGGLVAEPGVDQRPSFPVIDEIDVHVVEQERQGQPRPQDPRRNFDRVARRRRPWMDEAERFGAGERHRMALRNGGRLHSVSAHRPPIGGPVWR